MPGGFGTNEALESGADETNWSGCDSYGRPLATAWLNGRLFVELGFRRNFEKWEGKKSVFGSVKEF